MPAKLPLRLPALYLPALHFPALYLNGIAVTLGLGGVQLALMLLADGHAARLALGTAVCASLADKPLPMGRTWHRVSSAVLISLLATLLIALSRPSPVAVAASVVFIGFASTMMLGFGPRAGPVSFAAILSIVFALSAPAVPPRALPAMMAWHACGGMAYLLWSLVCARAFAGTYRTLALLDLLDATAARIRRRAALVGMPDDDPGKPAKLRRWLYQEAAFVERLQAARDFIFAGPPSAREAAILVRTIDLRDSLVVSRFDRALPRDAARRRSVIASLVAELGRIAGEIEAAARALRGGRGALRANEAFELDSLGGQAGQAGQAGRDDSDGDPGTVAALTLRLRAMREAAALVGELARGAVKPNPLRAAEAIRFVSAEAWSPGALRAQWHRSSPTLRHAARLALALGSAFAIAPWLPWSSHPQWLVLSVAVVLRGTMDQTLARRNGRLLGTLAGCLLVLLLALSERESGIGMALLFLVAAGTAHTFVTTRYWLTAVASTVMALLQAHAIDPTSGFAIGERAADTVLGALLAWGFAYVWPDWERGKLPAAVTATVAALGDYAHSTLQWPEGEDVERRLARDRGHRALASLAAMMQRSGVEPKGVRLAEDLPAALLDRGRRLMADLSAVRLLIAERGEDLDREATGRALQAIDERVAPTFDLSVDPGVDPGVEPGVELGETSAPSGAIDPALSRRLRSLVVDAARMRAAANVILDEPARPGSIAR